MKDLIKRLRELELENARVQKERRRNGPFMMVYPFSILKDTVQIRYYPNGYRKPFDTIWTTHDGANEFMDAHPEAGITINWLYCVEWYIVRYAVVGDANISEEFPNNATEEMMAHYREQFQKEHPEEYENLMNSPRLIEALKGVPQFTTRKIRK